MALEIDIEVRPDGTLAFGVKGVKGRKCKEITAFLEELGQTLATEATAEYWQVEEESVDVERIRVEKS